MPKLRYSIKGNEVTFWWENVVEGFNMPVTVAVNGKNETIRPTSTPNTRMFQDPVKSFVVDRNYYVESKKD